MNPFCKLLASALLVAPLPALAQDDAAAQQVQPGRLTVFAGEKEMYAHPAFVGPRAYLRGASSVVCLDLGK